MSGERKALLVFIILFLLDIHLEYQLKLFFLFLIYLMLNVLNTFIENPYINNKIDNMLNILQTGNVNYFFNTGEISPNDTYSNLQRVFHFKFQKNFF